MKQINRFFSSFKLAGLLCFVLLLFFSSTQSHAKEVIVDFSKLNLGLIFTADPDRVESNANSVASLFCKSQGFDFLVSSKVSDRKLGRIKEGEFIPTPYWEFIADGFGGESLRRWPRMFRAQLYLLSGVSVLLYFMYDLVNDGTNFRFEAVKAIAAQRLFMCAADRCLSTFPTTYAFEYEELKCAGDESKISPDILAEASSKQAISEVDSVLYSDLQSEDKGLCTICIANIESEDLVAKTKCSHYFHAGCVGPWLEQKTTCPNCREDISSGVELLKVSSPNQQTDEIRPSEASSSNAYEQNLP